MDLPLPSVGRSELRKHPWNPREVLGIDPLSPRFICIGNDVISGTLSRCFWRLNEEDCREADGLLNNIREDYILGRPLQNHLYRLARRLLCPRHLQYQAAEMAKEWALRIQIRESGKGFKGGTVETLPSNVQVMKQELDRMKVQSALLAASYSDLQVKYTALKEMFESLQQDQIRLNYMYDSRPSMYPRESEMNLAEKLGPCLPDVLRLVRDLATAAPNRGRYAEALKSIDCALIDCEKQLSPPKMQKLKENDLGNDHSNDRELESSTTLGLEGSDDEIRPTRLISSSKSLEGLENSSISGFSVEELSVLTNKIVSIFANDERLQSLCSSALKTPSIDATQFKSNFRRFLMNFAKELGNEAQRANQKNIALVVRVCADEFAMIINNHFMSENSDYSECIEQWNLENADSVKLLMLSHYFRSNGTREAISPLHSEDEPDPWSLTADTAPATDADRCQFSGIRNSADDFSNNILSLTEVRQFIVQSKAFDILQQQLDQFVNSDHGVLMSSFASAISYAVDNNRVVQFTPWTMTTRPGFIDRIKGTIEKWIRNPVIWWPLRPPRTWCPSGYMRISWACVSSSRYNLIES